MYSPVVVEEVQDEAEATGGEEANVEEGEGDGQQPKEPLLLSLNALNGISAYQTMRVTGKVKNTPLHILIDSGSAHNFLDLATAKRLNCEIRKIPPLQVVVANGQQLVCNSMCRTFAWSLLGETFVADVMLIPLGNCEMVLGIQWLAGLGPILWDLKKLRMEFKKGNRRIVLRGTQKTGMEWMGRKGYQHTWGKSGQLFAIQIQALNPEVELCSVLEETPALTSELQLLLKEYEDVFAEPTALPPQREFDHKIVLKPGTNPIIVKPY